MLCGTLVEIAADHCIIDVSGVGYKVFCSGRIFDNVRVNDNVEVRIETVVREDVILLYGFRDKKEQACFNLLLSVQGVGAKLAMVILDFISCDDLLIAINNDDVTNLRKISGVGPRLASRLSNELKSSKMFKALFADVNSQARGNIEDADYKNDASVADRIILQDVISAMVGLGFSQEISASCARSAVQNMQKDATLDDVIREALNLTNIAS